MPRSSDYLKRVIDLIFALIAGVAALPLWVLLLLVVRIKHGSPVFFNQTRPGRYGKPFTLYKFKSMTEKRDVNGRLLPDADRLTPFGKVLRSTSLDELPELFNVLKGEMSLVGPRPLLVQYLERYTPEQARRHEVKPGLTGWAQVNGRNAISWGEKFALDVWYVDNQSLWLDIKIILMTVKKVVFREGISAEGEATMPEFYPQITQINADLKTDPPYNR
ncbi:MAG: sugar transferase [Desulfobacterales bacterium]|jgi:sugar transferase EpsL|nr:sugar transferase [Desulfobacterales bacterium]